MNIINNYDFQHISHFNVKYFFDIISIFHYSPFDVMSGSAFLTFEIILVLNYFPFEIFLSHSALIISTLCSIVIISHSTFCPFDVFSIQRFPVDLFPIRRFVLRRSLPSTFFTSTFFGGSVKRVVSL